MEHTSYSPDLAPNDLWLFTKVKSDLKGRNDGTERHSTAVLKMLPTVAYHWAKCITA